MSSRKISWLTCLIHFNETVENEKRNPSPWNLGNIPRQLWNLAEDSIEAGDFFHLLGLAGSKKCLDFVIDNAAKLKVIGVYEYAIYHSYNMAPTAFFDTDVIKYLFLCCDRQMLLSAGHPLPGTGPYTLFRGVSNGQNKTEVRRFSWTLSPEIASWFAVRAATRLGTEDPAVFRLVVPENKVYFFCDERKEKEFVIDMYPQARPKRLVELPIPRLSEDREPFPSKFWPGKRIRGRKRK